MRRRHALLVFLGFFVFELSLSSAQIRPNNLDVQPGPSRNSSGSGEMKSERFFHSVLENERVRVLRIEVPPMQSTTPGYRRHDYVVLSLGKSNFEIAGAGMRFPMQMEDGEMQVLKGGSSHRITNLADTALRLIELEVAQEIHPERPLCGLGGRACSDFRFGKSETGMYTQSTLFETDTVKLARVELGPMSLLPEHRHDRCHVLIALSNAALLDENTNQDRELHLKAGDAAWYSQALAHSLKNLQVQEVQLITLEFK
jgi:quercetin dioxygenase-like cupin family protein/mannose-6-phosphate isomerase-like protein (cupin superfamily)